jgi:hypothetical protein
LGELIPQVSNNSTLTFLSPSFWSAGEPQKDLLLPILLNSQKPDFLPTQPFFSSQSPITPH